MVSACCLNMALSWTFADVRKRVDTKSKKLIADWRVGKLLALKSVRKWIALGSEKVRKSFNTARTVYSSFIVSRKGQELCLARLLRSSSVHHRTLQQDQTFH